MLEDVLAALAEVRGLAGRVLITTDDAAMRLAPPLWRSSARADGAGDGHTGAVTAAARRLARERRGGMLDRARRRAAGHRRRDRAPDRGAPRRSLSFTIAPSHDEQGLERDPHVAARCGAAALWRRQLLPHLAAAAALRHRARRLAPARNRPGYRQAGRSRAFFAIGSRTRAGLWLAAGNARRLHAGGAKLRRDAMPPQRDRSCRSNAAVMRGPEGQGMTLRQSSTAPRPAPARVERGAGARRCDDLAGR